MSNEKKYVLATYDYGVKKYLAYKVGIGYKKVETRNLAHEFLTHAEATQAKITLINGLEFFIE